MPRVRYKHNPQPTRDEMKIMIKQQLLQVTMLLNQLGEAYRHINDLKMLSLFFEKWKVKSKCFEIEIEKWKFSRILNNSRETRFLNRFMPSVCALPFFSWSWISFWWISFEVNMYLKAHGTSCWWSGANGQDRHKAQGLGARLLNIDCTQSSTDSGRATMKIEEHCKMLEMERAVVLISKLWTMQLIYFTNKFHLRDITTPYWYNFFLIEFRSVVN